MNAASQRRLTPVLAGIAVVLGIVLVTLLSGLGRKVHWDKIRPPAALPPSTDASNLPATRPLESFALVWQKPLFSPDRKPIARVADGGTSLGDLSLTGIILTSDLRMALLHDKNGDREIRLREGQVGRGPFAFGSVRRLRWPYRIEVTGRRTHRPAQKWRAGNRQWGCECKR